MGREQVVGYGRKGILVGCRDRSTFPLFRGHVSWCAAKRLAHTCSGTGGFCHAKISQHQIRTACSIFTTANKKIGRLDILMHNLMVMGVLKGTGSLLYNNSNILWGEQGSIPALLHPGSKGVLFTKGHNHIGQCRSMDGCLTKVKEWQDVRMGEHGDSSCLAQEKTSRIGVGIFSLNDLDGYLPSQLVILRKVDFAHAPASEQTQKA